MAASKTVAASRRHGREHFSASCVPSGNDRPTDRPTDRVAKLDARFFLGHQVPPRVRVFADGGRRIRRARSSPCSVKNFFRRQPAQRRRAIFGAHRPMTCLRALGVASDIFSGYRFPVATHVPAPAPRKKCRAEPPPRVAEAAAPVAPCRRRGHSSDRRRRVPSRRHGRRRPSRSCRRRGATRSSSPASFTAAVRAR